MYENLIASSHTWREVTRAETKRKINSTDGETSSTGFEMSPKKCSRQETQWLNYNLFVHVFFIANPDIARSVNKLTGKQEIV